MPSARIERIREYTEYTLLQLHVTIVHFVEPSKVPVFNELSSLSAKYRVKARSGQWSSTHSSKKLE